MGDVLLDAILKHLKRLHIEAQHHRLRLEASVTIDDIGRPRTSAGEATANLLVLRRDAVGVSGQRLQDERGGVKAPPFRPVRQEEWIQPEMRAFQRT